MALEETHKDHPVQLLAPHTSTFPPQAWEHCPNTSGVLSGLGLCPLPWGGCSVPKHPLGEELSPDLTEIPPLSFKPQVLSWEQRDRYSFSFLCFWSMSRAIQPWLLQKLSEKECLEWKIPGTFPYVWVTRHFPLPPFKGVKSWDWFLEWGQVQDFCDKYNTLLLKGVFSLTT